MNNVSLIGRLTKDAELKYTETGKNVARFSVTVQGYNEAVSYFNCQKWDAEKVVQYLNKGRQIGITGSLEQKRWQNENGNQSIIIINVRQIHFIGNQQNEQGQQDKQGQQNEWKSYGNNPHTGNPNQRANPEQQGQRGEPEMFKDDIPF